MTPEQIEQWMAALGQEAGRRASKTGRDVLPLPRPDDAFGRAYYAAKGRA
jgi:hypothetical protein